MWSLTMVDRPTGTWCICKAPLYKILRHNSSLKMADREEFEWFNQKDVNVSYLAGDESITADKTD